MTGGLVHTFLFTADVSGQPESEAVPNLISTRV